MAAESYTVPIADPELARRKTEPTADDKNKESSMSEKDKEERDEVNRIIDLRKRYQEDRRGKEKEWVESFKMYMSWVDKALNPFLSNLFIPKTHAAVELLAAFLIGTNQNISASAENGGTDTMKARVASKWLDFLWRKVLKARLKILVWIKQGILFGNGIMKLGWDPVKKQAWMQVCALEDVYFDYFEAEIQDSDIIIHEIRRDPQDVKDDEKYDAVDSDGVTIRSQVIVGGDNFNQETTALFNTFDGSLGRSECRGKVLVMEVWCKEADGKPQYLKTLLPTGLGWRIARSVDNPNRWSTSDDTEGEQFRPFVKLRFKTSALPNRGYDMGAIWPTVHLQKAFNDLFRQYFDSVVLINNPMWKKRRGARINPQELVRRPGGIITMSDINKDLVADQVGDVKNSIIEMLNRLDREFQEASMVTNLVKGISQSQTATGDAIAQQNTQTLLDMINENIVEALSEAGQMALNISVMNSEGVQKLMLYENESETAELEFDPKNIDGMTNVRITPDRSDSTQKGDQNKVLTQFIALVRGDGATLAKYPSIVEKLYKRFLENDGIGDPDYFFHEDGPTQEQMMAAQAQQKEETPESKISVSMSYKDAPEDVRRDIEGKAGLKPSQSSVAPAGPMQSTAPTETAPVLP